jgi:molybdenum cofactor cytidylyltransferase
MVSAIILAAGTSSRMGTPNKLLLPFQETTIVRTVVRQIADTGIEDIIVVTGYESDQVTAALHGLPVHFVFNPYYALGMTSSIKQGVKAARGDGYMICLADMVKITSSQYSIIMNEFVRCHKADPSCIVIPYYQDNKGNPVVFSSSYRGMILQHHQPEGCREILQQNESHIKRVEMMNDSVLTDLDNWIQYQKLNH